MSTFAPSERSSLFLQRIYTLQSIDTLAQTVCERLGDLIPGDNVFIGRHDMARSILTGCMVRQAFSARDFLLQVNTHAARHPLWEPIRTGGQTVRTLSEHASKTVWHENGLYRALLCEDRVEDHASFEFGDRNGMLTSVGIFRSTRGFSMRDVSMMTSLIPHIELAFRNARRAEAMGILDDEETRAITPLILVTPEGRITEIPPSMRTVLSRFFDVAPGTLPTVMQRWLTHTCSAINQGVLNRNLTPLTIQRHGEKAWFRLYHRIDVPGYWLGVQVQTPDRVGRLSAREREILREVAYGRSNEEIANNLTISFFTVKAHLKNICRKLGVQSRTEAAVLYTSNIARSGD